MSTRKAKAFICAALILAVSGLLVAQNAGTRDRERSTRPYDPSQRDSGMPSGQRPMQQQQPSMMGGREMQGQTDMLRTSKTLGADVKNAQGQKIGTVENLALNTGQNRAQYAVLSLDKDQFRQASDALYLVSWNSLKVQKQQDTISVTANISPSDVQQAKNVQADWSDQLGSRQVKLISTAAGPSSGGLHMQRSRPGQSNGDIQINGEIDAMETPDLTAKEADGTEPTARSRPIKV